MLNNLTQQIDFHGRALVLRGQRQQILAANIANADTPGFVATELRFDEVMRNAAQSASVSAHPSAYGAAKAGHIPLKSNVSVWDATRETPVDQSGADRNTVNMDRERASFADNALHYEATLRFINGSTRTLLSAITGQ